MNVDQYSWISTFNNNFGQQRNQFYLEHSGAMPVLELQLLRTKIPLQKSFNTSRNPQNKDILTAAVAFRNPLMCYKNEISRKK